MIIRTIDFDPLKVISDSTEVPVQGLTYQDEDDVMRTLSYVVVNGEKVPIQYRIEIDHKLSFMKVDEALLEVEEDRKKKIEEEKVK